MEEKEVKISFWSSHLTLIVSVTFVLLLLGVMASVWISVSEETQRFRDRIQLNVVMADSITDYQALQIARKVAHAPYSRHVKLINKHQAMERWREQTGEDLEALYGVNPLTPEVEFMLSREYATSQQISSLSKTIMKIPGVESVDSPDLAMVGNLNRNLAGITLILAIVAGVMLLVSFVLINNTVHLSIYARRFTIHTMQLVGATDSFISRPIVGANVLCGLIAGFLATLLTAAVVYSADRYGLNLFSPLIRWEVAAIMCAVLMAVGILLCSITSWISTLRYLRKDYDKLFR